MDLNPDGTRKPDISELVAQEALEQPARGVSMVFTPLAVWAAILIGVLGPIAAGFIFSAASDFRGAQAFNMNVLGVFIWLGSWIIALFLGVIAEISKGVAVLAQDESGE